MLRPVMSMHTSNRVRRISVREARATFSFMTRALHIGILGGLMGYAGAGPAAAAPEGWEYSLAATTVRVPEVELDGGGDTGLTSYHLRASADRDVGASSALGARLYYDLRDRDFAGQAGFAALEPWDQTSRFGLAAFLRQRTRFAWSYGIRPFVNWSFETGAFSDDALSYGTALAVVAGVSRNRRVGAGARIYRDIDDGWKATPIVIVDWDFNEHWSLNNPREANFTVPAGLELRYRTGENWRFALAGIYETEDFRLDDRGIAPGGIGESTGILSYFRASRRWASGISINGYIGAVLDGELQIDDAGGNKLASSGYDTAPFAAVSVEGTF